MKKGTIIGVGSLGSCIAYEMANREIVDELVLIDVYKDLAEGNAADIEQAMAFRNNIRIRTGEYKDAEGSDIIIVTAGKPRTPDMKSRFELLKINQKIIMDVALNLKKLKGEFKIVTLSNPVDIMNFLMWKYTGFDRKKIIGSAGMLDSARFRCVLSERYNAAILDVEAFVIGEHGDNQVPVFSKVKLKGKNKKFNFKERKKIIENLKESAHKVIVKKGATIFAPANNTVNIIEKILKNEKKLIVSSVVLDGEYSLRDLSIGVPVFLGKNGVEEILIWNMNESEKKKFFEGAKSLKKTIEDLQI
jgi:malate dehydrogenase